MALLRPASLALLLTVVVLAGAAWAAPSTPAPARALPHQVTETAIVYANSTDPGAVPNTGLEMNLTVPTLPSRSPSEVATFFLSAGEVVGSYLFLLGILANSTTPGGVTPGVVIVNNATGALVAEGFSSTAAPGTSLLFQASALSGTSTWVFHLNGQPFSGTTSYNLGATTATWTDGIGVGSSGQWTGSAWAPSNITLPQALLVQQDGSWNLPHPVVSRWAGTTTPTWGMIGDAQSQSLAPGEIAVGSDVPLLTNGTALWTSAAATPATVAVTVTPTSCSSGGSVAISAHVSAGGVSLVGQSVNFSSSNGGTFTMAGPSSSSGWSNTTFTAPSVGITTNLTLTATVANPSYVGSGSATLTVQGALPGSATVAVTLASSQVGVGHRVALKVHVTGGGNSLGNVSLGLAASPGGGAFSPFAPWTTDAAGWAYGNYTAPSAGTVVTLWVNITTTGMEGSGSARLTLTGGGTSNPGSSGTSTDEVVAVVFIALVIVGLLILARRRRPTAPAEDETEEESTPATKAPAAKASKAEPAAPAAKTTKTPAAKPGTCPACGAALPDPAATFCPGCGLPVKSARTMADD